MGSFYQKINIFLNRYYWFLFVGMSVYAAFLCFYRLDAGYIVSWDESRHGISAYEMLQTKNYIVNTVNYAPDYWNLKPPLSFYGIMLGFRIFGYSAVGLRFYSALSYFFICMLCTLYMKKHYGKFSSLLCLAFLCCNQLMFKNHGARAGDADALYQLFFTIAMLAMMDIPKKHSRSYLCGFCFSIAFLTKSYHALIILGIGGLYMLMTGEIRRFQKKEWFWFAFWMVLPCSIWAIARYLQDGLTFFLTMISEDVLSRSKTASEGHAGPWDYYINAYFLESEKIYGFLLLIIIATGIYGIGKRKKALKQYLGYLLWFFVPLFCFSVVKTKLIWYNFPIFIPLMMLAAISCGKFFECEKVKDTYKQFSLLILLGVLVFYGYHTVDSTVLSEKSDRFQIFLAESVERTDLCAGANAFIQVPQEIGDGSIWNANVMLAAEMEGDFKCHPYGVFGYLNCENKKVLYISREDYTNMKDILVGEILFETEEYLMIGDNL